VRFRATGDSMWPLIQSGDYLLVEPAAASNIARGDVVLARLDRGLTAHRVIEVRRDGASLRITTRGDNAPQNDAPFTESAILGRVTHAERDGHQSSINRTGTIFLAISRAWVRAAARLRRLFVPLEKA
ncbi:MAG TPA: S24/S26 family peptidase, partial [Thermoanaerobaculia bacterium]|nr:S24/S26 family peptidase [Thermoanaerobaculia bacterium]